MTSSTYINVKNGIISLLFTTVLIFLSGCGEQDSGALVVSNVSDTPAAEVIVVKGAYIRAMPPGQKVTAMFMTLANTSEHVRSLVKVESDVSAAVELHEHKNENGMMKMGQVANISLPSNASVALAPGGYHVMLIGLKTNLTLGDTVPMKLIFADGSSQQIEPEVKSIAVD